MKGMHVNGKNSGRRLPKAERISRQREQEQARVLKIAEDEVAAMKAEQDLMDAAAQVESEWKTKERESFVAGFSAAMSRRAMREGRVDTGVVRDSLANRYYEDWRPQT